MKEKENESFCPANRKAWRQWLKKHHASKETVWLILYKKQSGQPTINWSDAVDEALCFGWIDSKRMPFDKDKFIQAFSRRKAGGTWSKVNKAKILQLIEDGLMTKAGLDSIENAKQNGSWTILDEVEELKIPGDLLASFKNNPGSKKFFLSLNKSVKKSMLQWLVLAKRIETRQKRIIEISTLAAQQLKPKQF